MANCFCDVIVCMQVGGLISERLKHPMTWLLKVALWLLSTWFGTLVFCGIACLSTHFPFIHTYPHLPLHKRQHILQSWSLSYFRLLRTFFRTIKLLTLLVFFTQVIIILLLKLIMKHLMSLQLCVFFSIWSSSFLTKQFFMCFFNYFFIVIFMHITYIFVHIVSSWSIWIFCQSISTYI